MLSLEYLAASWPVQPSCLEQIGRVGKVAGAVGAASAPFGAIPGRLDRAHLDRLGASIHSAGVGWGPLEPPSAAFHRLGVISSLIASIGRTLGLDVLAAKSEREVAALSSRIRARLQGVPHDLSRLDESAILRLANLAGSTNDLNRLGINLLSPGGPPSFGRMCNRIHAGGCIDSLSVFHVNPGALRQLAILGQLAAGRRAIQTVLNAPRRLGGSKASSSSSLLAGLSAHPLLDRSSKVGAALRLPRDDYVGSLAGFTAAAHQIQRLTGANIMTPSGLAYLDTGLGRIAAGGVCSAAQGLGLGRSVMNAVSQILSIESNLTLLSREAGGSFHSAKGPDLAKRLADDCQTLGASLSSVDVTDNVIVGLARLARIGLIMNNIAALA